MVSQEIRAALDGIRAAEVAGDDLLLCARAKEALRRFPNSPDITAVQASHLCTTGSYAEAESLVRMARERWPDSAHLLAVNARLSARLARIDEAVEYARRALNQNDADPWVLEWCSDAFTANGNNQKSFGLIQRWRETNPDDFLGISQEIVYLHMLGRTAESSAALEAAEARWPDSAQLARYRARTLTFAHRLTDAEKVHRRAIELAPNSAMGWAEFSTLLGGLGQLAESEQAAMRALAINPGLTLAMNRMAFICERRGQRAEASEWRRKSEEALPVLAALTALGPAAEAMRSRQWKKALRLSEPAVSSKMAVMRKSGLNCRLRALLALSRFGDAERTLDELQTLTCADSIGDKLYYLGRGKVALARRDRTAAVDAFRAGLERFPIDGELRASLLQLLRQMGRTEEADALCRDAMEHPPEAVWGFWALIPTLFRTRDWEAARSLLRMANTRFPDSPELRILNAYDRVTRRKSRRPSLGALVNRILGWVMARLMR
jgi:tetratricopeptide (TPR) repeat protein